MQPYQLGSTEWIKQELAGLLGQQVTQDLSDIVRLYSLYDGPGQVWQPKKEGLDYDPTVKTTNFIKKLIKEEARFMMGVEPEINFIAKDGKRDGDAAAELTRWLADFLRREGFGRKLIAGARDCFIGKRVAIKLTGARGGALGIQFRPSLEFVYDTDPEDVDTLSKVIFFYHTNESIDLDKQRIWRQKYRMEGGRCLLDEAIYDGNGRRIEVRHEDEDTGLDFIPVYVIINDGLTGDMTGESDVAELIGNQDTYNRLISDDRDALKFNMFPMRVFKDASQETMNAIKIAPGAVVDGSTDPVSAQQMSVEILESKFAYDARIEHALDRAKSDMFELLSVPNVGPDQLKAYIASGKTMQALYWGLRSRCEEKWNAWDAALIWMAESLLKMARAYGTDALPEIDGTVTVEHRYPIPDDEDAERASDMQEVAQQLRSRQSYIAKWEPDTDSAAELSQIVAEQRMLGDDFGRAMQAELATESET